MIPLLFERVVESPFVLNYKTHANSRDLKYFGYHDRFRNANNKFYILQFNWEILTFAYIARQFIDLSDGLSNKEQSLVYAKTLVKEVFRNRHLQTKLLENGYKIPYIIFLFDDTSR